MVACGLSDTMHSLIIIMFIGSLSILAVCGKTIQCDESVQGIVEYQWHQRFFNPPLADTITFINNEIQNITFTTCDSEFFAGLKLINSSGAQIQSQSLNHCDGCDCDSPHCTRPKSLYQTTFEMEALPAGEYTLEITNECGDSDIYIDGPYNVFVICGGSGIVSPFIQIRTSCE